MACTQYAYVKSFERDDRLLPNTWLVVRLDGQAFHQFSKAHQFAKPNDAAALDLMNACARSILQSYQDIVLAYGESDEMSFLLPPHAQIFRRREAKLVSTIASQFAAQYTFLWPQYMPNTTLQSPPVFDARAVVYPTVQNVRDYFAWRQADCHINNLYNTTFWTMVLDPKHPERTTREVEAILKDTNAAGKNEILFTQYDINYAHLPAMFRKGSTLFRTKTAVTETSRTTGEPVVRQRDVIQTTYDDLIGDAFWDAHPAILTVQAPRAAKLAKNGSDGQGMVHTKRAVIAHHAPDDQEELLQPDTS
ncbi:hypothetical protein CXG81DRAFT_29176 [Caulochytrium protostelioides]|uniref:tRNA(His) guanylyltransferase n=1 Tax=Caulochytrium protostelioides TaxID=1555241 RepID=A0A4P9XE07_9FUNG|nr:hypothetical protein CXG81DRAFT_29176 [Caulochytrium protostelioides]|eukprot:RKP03755.1 hypothetical protein CXG81DRAFT_29176 [Caulochytrium protostelioides]